MLVKELKKHLREHYKPNQHVAVHIWQVDDVLGVAESKGIKISKRKANEVIDNIHRQCDSELGITWITIECALEDI